jgi:hypothetical protein
MYSMYIDSEAEFMHPSARDGGADHAGGVKLIDSTLVIVLHNGEQEIERELASPADALRVALMMLARRGRLEIGDVLKVLAPG